MAEGTGSEAPSHRDLATARLLVELVELLRRKGVLTLQEETDLLDRYAAAIGSHPRDADLNEH